MAEIETAHRAIGKARPANPASRLRRRLAASVFLLAGAALSAAATAPAAAGSTLVIDSRGASYMIGKSAGPLPPRRSAGARTATGSVTLDLTVLDGLEQVRPEGRRGPLRLTPPAHMANAGRTGAVHVRSSANAAGAIKLRPPSTLSAAAPPITLRPPRRPAAHSNVNDRRMDLAAAPLPPRRNGQSMAASPRPSPDMTQLATAAPAPTVAPVLMSPLPSPDSASGRAGPSTPATVTPAPSAPRPQPNPAKDQSRSADAPVIAPVRLEPAKQSSTAAQAGAPASAPDAPAGWAAEPTMRVADTKVSEELRRKFPIIFERQEPPAMAQPGWKAPAGAQTGARPEPLPALASLAPPPQSGPKAPAVPLPGDAIAAPPPPPIAKLPSARAIGGDLPPAAPPPPPRHALAIPPGLDRVRAPGDGDATTQLTVLTPPDAGDVATAPDFAPLPTPESRPAVARTELVAAPAPAPQQLSLALPEAPARPPPASSRPAGPYETEIAFAGTSRSLPADAEPALSRIADRLKADPALKVRLSGAASAGSERNARDLALARALAVQNYLVSRGVLSEAIRVEPVSGAPAKDAVGVKLVDPA